MVGMVGAPAVNRLARRVAVGLAVVAQSLAPVVVSEPAYASDQTSPLAAPDGHGNYGYCNVTLRAPASGSTTKRPLVSCAVAAGTVSDLQITISEFTGPSGVSTGPFSFSGWPSSWLTFPAPGQVRGIWTGSVPAGTGEVSSATITGCAVTLDGVTRPMDCAFLPNGGTSPPAFRSQYFEGGTAQVPPMSAPTLSCSRVMVDRATTFANFTSAATGDPPPAGSSDAFSWAWGDGTPNWPNRTAGHDYPALETMPANGWTATVTLSRTRGAEVVTGTCALRVDFNQPDKSEAGSDATSEDDYDCPSGIGWINPLAILKILKCLFIPSDADLDGLADFYGEAKTKAPFSYAVQVLTFVPAVMGQLAAGGADGASYDDGSPNCGEGVFTGGQTTGGGTPLLDLPGTNGVQVPSVLGCGSGTGGAQSVNDGGQWFQRMRMLFQILYLVGLAIGVWSIVTWAIS